MKITASQIADWAATKEGQASLPRLVRRLILAIDPRAQTAFPAGDSTSQPDWDGEVEAPDGGAWVPTGKSYWELSCEASVTKKANKDYTKRTAKHSDDVRKAAAYVAVSARRWTTKKKWRKTTQDAGAWAEIRSYDADDLEQWLEQCPAVALQFAEELGLTGPGVESVEHFWRGWSTQSKPPISVDAFLVDRADLRDRFIKKLRAKTNPAESPLVRIRADSVEEAAAFACAIIGHQPELSPFAVAVTHSDGWRFIEKNRSIKIAIATAPDIAKQPSRRGGLNVIVPCVVGDPTGGVSDDLLLERPRIYEFVKALTSIGFDEADAHRIARATGRSWSVFRRHRAVNPSIRSPEWLDTIQAQALSTLCLLGAWTDRRDKADREIVARVAGRPYDAVEKDLRFLAKQNDAPVLHIGEVWKAKSPLELLDLFGDRITTDELDRFFCVVQETLTSIDPVIELPESERWKAQINNKVRRESGPLLEALCDTLTRLAVRGRSVPDLATAGIESRVALLVRELLDDADEARWLSLASLLPSLAEAAPDEFLVAVESSLAKPEGPVLRLLKETRGSGFAERCWHSGLLWALERLAWSPQRLTRVALLLAELSRIPIKGNWENSPENSLLNLFRSWLPQTAATIERRLATLNDIVAGYPQIAFELLDRLVYTRDDTGNFSARPRWRDEDAGAGRGVPYTERVRMIESAADFMIEIAKGTPERIARLARKLGNLDSRREVKILALAEAYANTTCDDEGRETIRREFRERIHWHRNYDKIGDADLEQKLQPWERLYEMLAPTDLVVRHAWLFDSDWPDLPMRVRSDLSDVGKIREDLQIRALAEIFDSGSWVEINRLVASAGSSWTVGIALNALDRPKGELAGWIYGQLERQVQDASALDAVSGLLRVTPDLKRHELLQAVVARAQEKGWNATNIARILTLAPDERATWDLGSACGEEVELAYWASAKPGFWPNRSAEELDFVLRRLLEAGRPRSALAVCQFDYSKVDPIVLAEALERLLLGEEPESQIPASYRLAEAIEVLERPGAIDKQRLFRLEFGLIPALGFDGKQTAKALYKAIMSEPELFTELVCLVYKPDREERDEPLSEGDKNAAKIAWQVLHHCKRLPGTRSGDGSVDSETFVRFIDDVRELCSNKSRLGSCDRTLGAILAHSPIGEDGGWPFEAARDVLDRAERDDMRHGFLIGAMNKRGATSRAPDEGGRQERNLAEKYRGHAALLSSSHPRLAAALERLARWYDGDATREDIDAALSREDF